MSVITRFAPSPTGYLHIGSARTALFNYLYAKHYGGKFLLRVEDTDRERSTEGAKQAILNGLKWLEIDWDGEVVYQASRGNRHAEIAKKLLDEGKAYYCFCTQEEIEVQRQQSIKAGESFLFNSPWRDAIPADYPQDKNPVIRLKAPRDGKTLINDLVQGEVEVENKILDDMVLLRGDGTATYMLAVVVDDHDMGITHIIRGDDHLNNAFRQKQLYLACGWGVPVMAHIPLIHGPDGAKLSKRHGALGVEAYRDMGYLPDALFNYLLKLGWGHGNDEIISRKQAIEWFDVTNVGKAPARLDFDKMRNLNGHYIRESENDQLLSLIEKHFFIKDIILSQQAKSCILKAMPSLKLRAELIPELAELALIYHPDNIYELVPEALEVIKTCDERIINKVINLVKNFGNLDHNLIQEEFKKLSEELEIKLGKLMQPIRALITGRLASPSVFEIIGIIGIELTLQRLNKFYQLKSE